MDELIFLTEPMSSAEQLERNFLKLLYDIPEDKKYHFGLLIGRNWKIVDDKPKIPDYKENLRSIAVFRRVKEPLAEIEIIASLIPREVNPSDWLELWLQNENAIPVNGRTFETDYGTVGDFLAIIHNEKNDNHSEVLRTLSIKDYNRVFAIICKTLKKDYNDLAEEFLMALSSFELTNPTSKMFAEKMGTVNISTPVKCSFLFPDSWQKRLDKTSSESLHSVSFYNFKGKSNVGIFTFISVLKSLENNKKSLLSNYIAHFQEKGIKLMGTVELLPVENSDTLFQTLLPMTDAKGGEFEINAILSEDNEAIMLFAIFSFIDSQHYDIHIINKRAFEIALSTFKRE